MGQPAYQIIEEDQAATLLQHPIRKRLLSELSEPKSAAGLARVIDLPRQKVNYHLRELEKAGLVETHEERTRGNAKERIMVAKATHYILDPSLLTPEGEDLPDSGDRLSLMHLVGAMARGIRELLTIRKLAAKAEKKRVATITLESEICFRSAAERKDYADALANTIAKLNRRFHKEGAKKGRSFKLQVGMWPSLTKKETSDEE